MPGFWYNKFKECSEKSSKKAGMFWARDHLSQKGVVKAFAYLQPSKVFEFMQGGQRIMYEWLLSEDPQCFALDVDYEYQKEGNIFSPDYCLEILLNDIIPAVKRVAQRNGLQEVVPCQLFSSCRQTKFSYHVHFPSYFFKDRNVLSYFASLVWQEFRAVNCALLPDDKIYGYGKRAFRLAYNHKLGKPDGIKVPLNEDGSPILFEEIDFDTFEKMLLRTQLENVKLTSHLEGYDSNKKYGNPTRKKQGLLVKEKPLEPTSNQETKRRKICKTEEEYIQIVKEFHERHGLGWDDGKVYSVDVDNEYNNVSVRIQPRGSDTKCFAGEIHRSNGIMYTIRDGRVISSYCHGCDRNVFPNNSFNTGEATVDICFRTNEPTQDCVEIKTECFKIHQCGSSSKDLRHAIAWGQEYSVFKGFYTSQQKERKYHSDTLLQDLYFHVDDIAEGEVKHCTVFLLGSCGSGKTSAVSKILKHYQHRFPQATMLCQTSRRALASQLFESFGELGFVEYKNYEKPDDAKKLVIQVESMYKLFDEDYLTSYDVVVIDELTSHLKQLVARTMSLDKQIQTIRYFNWVVKNAKLVLCMCADAEENGFVYKYIEKLRREALEDHEYSEQVFCVRSPAAGLEIFREDPESVKAAVFDALDQGKNVWFCTNSRTEALKLKHVVQDRAKRMGNTEVFNGVLLVSGQSKDISEESKDKVFHKNLTNHIPTTYLDTDGNEHKNKGRKKFPVRLFMFTPAITHGFSYEDDENYFTAFMAIFVSSEVPARDQIQQLKRHRKATSFLVAIKQSTPMSDKEIKNRVEQELKKLPESDRNKKNKEAIRKRILDEIAAEDAQVLAFCENDTVDKKGNRFLVPIEMRHEVKYFCNKEEQTVRNCVTEITEFFEKETLRSKQSLETEFLRVLNQQGVHIFYTGTFSDGFKEAHADHIDEYFALAHIQSKAQKASQVQTSTTDPAGQLNHQAAKHCGVDDLTGCPKTIAATILLEPVLKIFLCFLEKPFPDGIISTERVNELRKERTELTHELEDRELSWFDQPIDSQELADRAREWNRNKNEAIQGIQTQIGKVEMEISELKKKEQDHAKEKEKYQKECRALKIILELYGFSNESPHKNLLSLLNAYKETGTFVNHVCSDWKRFQELFRILHERNPKQLRNLGKKKKLWNVDKKRYHFWNKLANSWLTKRFKLLIDQSKMRPQLGAFRLRVAWPFKEELFRSVLNWASKDSSIQHLDENHMPDLCQDRLNDLKKKINNILILPEDHLKRGSRETNSKAALARITASQTCYPPEKSTISADEYNRKKRTQNLLFSNTVMVQ